MKVPVAAALLSQIKVALRPLADALQAVAMRAHMVNQFALLGIRAGRPCAVCPGLHTEIPLDAGASRIPVGVSLLFV